MLNYTENTNEAFSETKHFNNDTLHVSADQNHRQVQSVQTFKKLSPFAIRKFFVSEVSLICDYILVLYKYILLIYIYILYNIYIIKQKYNHKLYINNLLNRILIIYIYIYCNINVLYNIITYTYYI